MEVGVPVTVTDEIDPNLYEIRDGSPYVEYFDAVERTAENNEQLAYRNALPRDMYTVSPDKQTVSFTTTAGAKDDPDLPPNQRGLEGRIYWVTWSVKVLDGGQAGTYYNTASYTVGQNGETVVVPGTAIRQGGSGEAVGENEGRLEFEKLIDDEGTAAQDPNLPSSFMVNYTACDTTSAGYDPIAHSGPGCVDGQQPMTVGNKTSTPSFPAGTRVVGTEVVPTEPPGVIWDGQFQLVDGNGNNIPGQDSNKVFDVTFSEANGNLNRLTYFRVTNKADYEDVTSVFEARKVVEPGQGATVPGNLPDFELRYSYPAATDDSFPEGSGVMYLPANGQLRTGGEIPVGANVTLTEVPPAAVPGHTWGEATISPSQFVMGPPPANVQVTVTNPLVREPVPGFELVKISDPATGTAVVSGDTITYTLQGRNTGETVLNDVTIVDDVSGLSEYVTYNNDAQARYVTPNGNAPDPVVDFGGAGTISWKGELQPGQGVDITFSVTIDANVEGVDLVNNVSGSAVPPGKPPIVPTVPGTVHPVPGFELLKVSDPASGTSVQPGDRITYTVTGTNTGSTVLDPVVITDDLSGIWGEVIYQNDADASINNRPAAEPVINDAEKSATWTGVLQPGETVTITYSVIVATDYESTYLHNKVSGEAKPPGIDPIVPPESETEHFIPEFTLEKVADPVDQTEVDPGDTITYTVTGTNTGATRLDPVDIVDDLSGFFDASDVALVSYNNDAAAAITDVDGAPVPGAPAPAVDFAGKKKLTWSGSLEEGERVTITYSVTVLPNAIGHELENLVSGTAQPPEGDPLIPPDQETEHPVPNPDFKLYKAANPEENTEVHPGEVITYTVTGVNTGATVLDPVNIRDSVAGLSPWVTYNNDARVTEHGAAGEGDLTADFTGTQEILWEGVLQPNEQCQCPKASAFMSTVLCTAAAGPCLCRAHRTLIRQQPGCRRNTEHLQARGRREGSLTGADSPSLSTVTFRNAQRNRPGAVPALD